MRGISKAPRLWHVGAAGLLLASGLAVGGPVRGGDEGGGPFFSAFSTGEAGCTGNPPLGPNDCDGWEQILNTGEASTWELDEEVGLTIAGGAMAATATADIVEQVNADGTFGSLTLTATLESTLTGGGSGAARLEVTSFFAIPGESVSVIGQASVDGRGTAIIGGSGDVEVAVACEEEAAIDLNVQVLGGAHGGEAGRPNQDAKSEPINQVVPAPEHPNGGRFCSVRVFMDAAANTNRANPGSEHGSGKATISLTILAGGGAAPSATPASGDCALSGTVLDGDEATELHANPLAGIRVELLRDGSVVGGPVATDLDGRYCFLWAAVPQTAPRSPEPGAYELRATLIDATREPPLFHTEHESLQQPVSGRFDVDDADWGVPEVELPFGPTDTKPWLSDVAHIHWQSARFVAWLVDVLLVPPAEIAGFTVRTFDAGGTRYTLDDMTVRITAEGSPFVRRFLPLSNYPENGEWHEIAHHLGTMLDIAHSTAAAACQGRINHGGWTNSSTCDSLGEGFAMFVPVVASLELDAGRDGGYATPHYAGLGSLELNNYSPWTFLPAADGTRVYREDIAISRLLWDLQDDTSAESELIVARPRAGGGVVNVTLRDRVALGGTRLIQLLMQSKPETVADIYDLLTTNPSVDAALRTADTDVDGDGTPDASPIDEVFLMHDFRPIGSGGNAFEVGSQVGHTPPGAGGLTDRRHIETVPGSVVRLVNTGTGLATFTIEIGPEGDTTTFAAPVPPGTTLDLDLELGPYWTEVLADNAELPACGAEGERLTTLAISGLGGVSESVDSCEYAHRVVDAGNGVALTVSAAGSEPVPSGAPGPRSPEPSPGLPEILILVVLALVGLAILGGVLILLRRRA